MDMTSWPLLMAGVMVMIAPIMILFVLAQRAFWVEVRS
jgi:ABC-type glycerol-3-phosphate transport system permease component